VTVYVKKGDRQTFSNAHKPRSDYLIGGCIGMSDQQKATTSDIKSVLKGQRRQGGSLTIRLETNSYRSKPGRYESSRKQFRHGGDDGGE
jgi:hypothetical protein